MRIGDPVILTCFLQAVDIQILSFVVRDEPTIHSPSVPPVARIWSPRKLPVLLLVTDMLGVDFQLSVLSVKLVIESLDLERSKSIKGALFLCFSAGSYDIKFLVYLYKTIFLCIYVYKK